MFKYMILMKRKRSISREQFIDYYENHHAPLLQRLVAGREIYRRNYVALDDPLFNLGGPGAGDDGPGFDVITECAFATRAEAEAARQAVIGSPDDLRRVREDEANFIEPGSVRMFVVEVRESPVA